MGYMTTNYSAKDDADAARYALSQIEGTWDGQSQTVLAYATDRDVIGCGYKGKGMEHVMAELHRHLAALLSAPSDLAPVIDKQVTTNIREVWTPTAGNFFSRVGGPYLNDLWSDLLGLASGHPTITTFQKLKKCEKAEKLESLFSDDAPRTALGLTDEQTARIAAWLPEGIA